jgi:hypothetical protein
MVELKSKDNIKFYNKQWFMWLTCFFLAPIGLFFMWKNKRLNIVVRTILTVFFMCVFITEIGAMNSTPATSANTAPVQTAEQKAAAKKIDDLVKANDAAFKKSQAVATAEEKVNSDKKAKEDAKLKAKTDKQKAYKDWIDAQFSPWDGSNTYLVDLVKENMNDPHSFEHVKTEYWDMKTYLIVKMTYRGKNAFGGLILQNVTAKSDYKANTIKITSQND